MRLKEKFYMKLNTFCYTHIMKVSQHFQHVISQLYWFDTTQYTTYICCQR